MRKLACSSEKNFQHYLHTSIRANKVNEGTTIANDSWSWNSQYRAARINDASTSVKGTVELNLGFLKVGDIIKLKTEVMNVGGVKAKIAIDLSNEPSVLVGSSGFANALIMSSSKTSEFETVEISFVVRTDAYYNILFGTFTADIGEFYIRNCVASSDSVFISDEITTIKQAIKAFTIRTIATGVFERDIRFGVDECTVTVNTNFLVITFSTPFTHTSVRPISFIGEEPSAGQYRVRASAPQSNTVTIQFYDRSTNALIDHTSIPTGVFFTLQVVGYDIA